MGIFKFTSHRVKSGVARADNIINGFSKTYAMTGWRIGYALGASDVVGGAGKIQSQSTSTPLRSLKPQPWKRSADRSSA